MGHVAPHRWADVAAGRVSEVERHRLEAHADACERCAGARLRVSGSFEALRAMPEPPAPELRWDHIWARIYWVTSSERRTAERKRARRPLGRWRLALAAPAALAVAGVAAWQLSRDAGTSAVASSASAEHASTPADPVVAPPGDEVAARPIRGLVTFAQGEVELGGVRLELDDPIEAGAELRTGSGRVTVQFDAGSGFTLGPRSQLTVQRFDDGAVELRVDGTVTVEVSRRAPGQRFAVLAGERQVVVRGTAFRVDHRDERLDVACSEGTVVVSDGTAQAPVEAGYRLQLDRAGDLRQVAVTLLDDARRYVLQDGPTMPLLPAWTDEGARYATSSVLDVSADPSHVVVVDGVEIGQGAFALRVMTGRHRVEARTARGKQTSGSWIDTQPGTVARAIAAAPEPAPPKKTDSGARVRRQQLTRALSDHPRIRGCLHPLEKQGLIEGSYLELDVGVGADGSLTHLNVVGGNLPHSITRCIRAVIDGVEFPGGPEATFALRLDF